MSAQSLELPPSQPPALAIHRAPASEPAYESRRGNHLYLVRTGHQLSFPEEDVQRGDSADAPYDREYYARQAVEADLPGALENYFGPQRTSTSRLPDVVRLSRVYCRAVAEILTGFRPLAQIRENTSPAVLDWIGQRVAELPRNRRRPLAPVVSCVRVGQPADGVAEVSAVVTHGPRSRAIAARFHGIDGAWRCVSLQII